MAKTFLEDLSYQAPRLNIQLLLLLSHWSRVRLCDPMDCSLLGSSAPGILQAGVLEWGAISFSDIIGYKDP